MNSELEKLHSAASDRHILDLFKADPARASKFSAKTADMMFDYSKTNIDQNALDALLALATDAGVAEKRDAMFSGEKINAT